MSVSLFMRTEWGNHLHTPLFHKGDIAEFTEKQEFNLSGVWVKLPPQIKNKKDIVATNLELNGRMAIQTKNGMLYVLNNRKWSKINLKAGSLDMLAEGVRSYCHCNIMSPAHDPNYLNQKLNLTLTTFK